MANCNRLFCDYGKSITPSNEQMQQMINSRTTLEKKIITKLEERLGMTPTFYTQGSASKNMRTIIIKENGTYDADRGVYLPRKPDVSATTVQRYVYEAVNDHTADGAEHRKKCIRVFYRCAYNIDFPVYYEVTDEDYAYMAVKDNGWIKDDPWHIITWFEKRKDADGQLVRMVKYLKGWASKCSSKMPSGIALTVWATNNYVRIEDRDDECLYNLLKAIRSANYYRVSCISPVEPYDDLTAKLTEDQKAKFRAELDKFIDDAKKALDKPNQLKASRIWQKYLGQRFPDGVDEDTDAKMKALYAAASVTSRLTSSGQFSNTSGVAGQYNRNYGS
ncbi:hypothetical protein FPZ43_03210 [Mucilaginibacter pallidiroseus]|uniref:Cyclic GMP-AMP synthase n=1 Tax=Mucilaginibacter pallidiroseus TaxID=2599295 RepID=A0A563UJN2_9SPHI|nr:hypothetical protein [Mucilaginibacter pallidiroseus]TWR31498.1 hypothetical protein FPZ43_03210 [Mucilaginibacter pallidiroseus]